MFINGNNHNYKNEHISIVKSGEDYFNQLQLLINEAKEEIHIQTYIFENDIIGNQIATALIAAVHRKVDVYILVDAYGSSNLSNGFISHLSANGINIRFFSPFFSKNSLYIGRRLHHKVVVIDQLICLVGGINIADKYLGNPLIVPWCDFAILVKEASIGQRVHQICQKIYHKKKKNQNINSQQPPAIGNQTNIKITQNDWLKQKNEIGKAYLKAIKEAQLEIIIVGGYFLPGRKIANALREASKRGVKVKLILSGISDVPLVQRATRFLYTSLLQYNIELYEWNKSILHGKAAIIDNTWSTIGSFNLNHLSSYGSIEMNIEVSDPSFSKTFKQHLTSIMNECEKITTSTLAKRNGPLNNILNWMSYKMARLSLIMATYITFKRY
jgi:cardiolipin synthase